MNKPARINIGMLRLGRRYSHVTHKRLQATIPITSTVHNDCSLTTRISHKIKKTRLSLHQIPTKCREIWECWLYDVCSNLVTKGQVMPQPPWSPTNMVLHIDSNLRHCKSTSRSCSRLSVQKKYHRHKSFAQKLKELMRLSSLRSEEGHVIDVRIIAKDVD